MTGIIDLRQIAQNDWKARYQGNYGIYTIRITTDGKKTVKFSCSCPSDYHPCKHIPMIEKAIAKQIAINERTGAQENGDIEDIINNITADKLKEFVITQAKYNSEFRNAFFLEFAVNAINAGGNKYSGIIQKILGSVELEECEYSYNTEDELKIEELDCWLDRVDEFLDDDEYDEAVLIAKAVIEEYSQWLLDIGDDYSYMFSEDYTTIPFDILGETADYTDKKELYEYCLSEMIKEKYAGTEFYENFNRLLGTLAASGDSDSFIALQNDMLNKIEDKSSAETEAILQRIIEFHKRSGQPDKAQAVIDDNLQIKSFRIEAVKKRIEDKNYSSAKKLIHEYAEKNNDQDANNRQPWEKLLLDIAIKENDIPSIRKLSFKYIEYSFNPEYYKIYKAAFNPAEWKTEREKLFLHYSKGKQFSNSAADFLAAESDTSRLIKYIEKYPDVKNIEKYHSILAYDYPEKTVDMFKNSIAVYAEANTGRSHYRYIISLLENLSKLPNGKKAARELTEEFRIRYPTRRVMQEMLRKFK